MTLGLLLLACTGEPPEHDDAPTLAIVRPVEGASLEGPDVEVELAVEGFAWIAPTARRPVPPPTRWIVRVARAHDPAEPPEGHVRVLLDGEEVQREARARFEVVGVAAGERTLEVELRWPDGDAFYPPVRDSVRFTVE